MSGDATTSEPSDAVHADPRRGWFAPTRPGPSRRALAGAVAITAVLLATWLVLALDLPRALDAANDGRAVTRTLRIDDSGRVRVGDARSISAPRQHRGSRGTPYEVVQAQLRMGSDVGRMRIDIDAPAGVDARDVALRARTPSAVVELRRTEDDEPWVSIERVRGGRIIVDVLVAMPSEGLLVEASGDAPRLRDATRPYDDKVVPEAASGRRLRTLHDNAAWLALAVLLLGIAAPILYCGSVRRRWYRSISTKVASGAAPTGPPKTMGTIDAATITMGADGVDVADGFAGHVLELVARERVRLRHTKDPRTGEGSIFGIASARADVAAAADADADATSVATPAADAAPARAAATPPPALAAVEAPLDTAAIALLAAIANEAGDTVQLPDATRLVADTVAHPTRSAAVEAARHDWRVALLVAGNELHIVERPRWRPTAIVAALAAALTLVAALVAVFASLDGTRVTAWYVMVLAAGPAGILGLLAQEQHRWTRVARARTGDRRAWVAWRAVLAGHASAGTATDLRNLPFVAATGRVAGMAPRIAGPSSVGLAAATPATVDALRVLAGGRPVG